MDFLEDRQGKDLADARKGFKIEEAGGAVLLHGSDDMQLELANELVVNLDQGEVGLDALADTRVGELIGDAGAVGSIDEFPSGLCQVELMMRVLDVGEQH